MSFYECPFYESPEFVSRVSIVMPCDFKVWTPSWTGWRTGTHHLDLMRLRICHASTSGSYLKNSPYLFHMRCSYADVFFAVFPKVSEVVLIYSKYHSVCSKQTLQFAPAQQFVPATMPSCDSSTQLLFTGD